MSTHDETDDDEMVAEYLHLVQEASIGLDMTEVPMVVATVDKPGTLIRDDGTYEVQLHWDILADYEGRLSARPTLVVTD